MDDKRLNNDANSDIKDFYKSILKSGKWWAGAICLQLATGFMVGFLVYQIGTLFVDIIWGGIAASRANKD